LSLKSGFLATALALMPFAAGLAEEPAAAAIPQPGQIFRDCPTCPEMVVLPAGEFGMGKTDTDRPQHPDYPPLHREIIPHAFAIGRFEVTREQFARFVSETGHEVESGCDHETRMGRAEHEKECMDAAWDDPEEPSESTWVPSCNEDYWPAKDPVFDWEDPDFTWIEPGFQNLPSHPVICVSHDDALAFVDWLATKTGKPYRLPSEVEWEYAYRAGTTTTYYWGDEPSHDQANYEEELPDGLSRWRGPVSVGSYPSNPFGLYDLAGNVSEWTDQCDVYDYDPKPFSPNVEEEFCSRWVARGGGWWYSHFDLQSYRRSGTTGPYMPYTQSAFDVGFRVVRDVFDAPKKKVLRTTPR